MVPHSGALPHFPLLDGTDTHFYFGWYHGDVRDIEKLAARVPRVVRFVSEFGAQSVPDNADFIDTSPWPELDWEHLAVHHGLQHWVFDQRVPPAEFATFDEWRHATQTYQAELVRHHIEVLRRLKYRPTGGFCVFAMNDASPMVSWGLLDHERAPKLGWEALRHACQPVLVIADRPPSLVTPDEHLHIDIHAVNDLRAAVDPAVVEVAARWAGGEQRWRFGGAVGAGRVRQSRHHRVRRPPHARCAHLRPHAHRRRRRVHEPLRHRRDGHARVTVTRDGTSGARDGTERSIRWRDVPMHKPCRP